MAFELRRVRYQHLNARQQENFNFQKFSGVLADYGFATMRLSDDWNGADFIALHCDGQPTLRIQVKGRFGFDKKYVGKGISIAFRDEDDYFLYLHDELFDVALAETGIAKTKSWKKKNGAYHFPKLSKQHRSMLERYRIKPA